MKTDELVDRLAARAAPVPRHAADRHFRVALGGGGLAAGLLLAVVFGVRADLAQAALEPMFWIKLAFPAALAAAGLVAARRLACPGMRLGRVPALLAAPVLAMALMAAWALLDAAPNQRAALVLGASWTLCPFAIALIALPVLGAALRAMKTQAPTRLVLSGAVAGLLAGAIGALIYALHCTEMQAPFIAAWYTTGIAIPVLAGAVLGPRCLRW